MQENPDALRAWKQELMLGHEVELEQLKLEKDSELNGLLELHNQMSVPDASEWKKKYEQLLKENDAQKLQIQEECQRKHRLEIEGLRSRLVNCAFLSCIVVPFYSYGTINILHCYKVSYDGKPISVRL